jgi:hypothetical protein
MKNPGGYRPVQKSPWMAGRAPRGPGAGRPPGTDGHRIGGDEGGGGVVNRPLREALWLTPRVAIMFRAASPPPARAGRGIPPFSALDVLYRYRLQ